MSSMDTPLKSHVINFIMSVILRSVMCCKVLAYDLTNNINPIHYSVGHQKCLKSISDIMRFIFCEVRG